MKKVCTESRNRERYKCLNILYTIMTKYISLLFYIILICLTYISRQDFSAVLSHCFQMPPRREMQFLYVPEQCGISMKGIANVVLLLVCKNIYEPLWLYGHCLLAVWGLFVDLEGSCCLCCCCKCEATNMFCEKVEDQWHSDVGPGEIPPVKKLTKSFGSIQILTMVATIVYMSHLCSRYRSWNFESRFIPHQSILIHTSFMYSNKLKHSHTRMKLGTRLKCKPFNSPIQF